ncbi:uncharacterized protein LOC143912699 isoform X2 [Arctopsyche grandis]|uniref:uncharacterized protein LOC143912699 isoform X2 n=1 Tax=Arctopsyche grandis TaxID=121162 RepID=UPI00406D69C5
MPVAKKSWTKKGRSNSISDVKRKVMMMSSVGKRLDASERRSKFHADSSWKKKKGLIDDSIISAEMFVLTKVAANIHKKIIWCDELPSEAAIAEARAASESEAPPLTGNDNNEDNIKRYTKEELLRIRFLPLCKRRPDCLNKPGCIAIGCWALNRRGVDALDDELVSKDASNDKRRPGDPRERIRKESEGIVLSPQRRSFTSGCFVVSGNVNNSRLRPDSPIFSQQQEQKNDIGPRDTSRRTGAGRVIPRDSVPWERSGDLDDPLGGSDYIPYRAPGSQRDRGDDRFERRSFARDIYTAGDKNRSDRDRDRELADSRFAERRERDEMRRGNRYLNDRRRGYEKDEEPEWFSGGPTSQNETIELRGFDDPVPVSTAANNNSTTDTVVTTTVSTSVTETTTTRSRPTRRSAGSGRTPSAVAAVQTKDMPPNVEELYKEDVDGQKERLVTVFEIAPKKVENNKSGGDIEKTTSSEERNKLDSIVDFNMDDFLKMDLGLNGATDEGYSGGSRFSRWFKRESPPATAMQQPSLNQAFAAPPSGPIGIPGPTGGPTGGPPTSASHDRGMNEHIFSNMINDLETSISIPTSDSQHLFAPISPAASTIPAHNSLLEMLRRGQPSNNHPQPPHFQHQQNMPMKIHSLEELEANMRGPIHQQQHQQLQKNNAHHQPPPDDSSAFKRLVEQMYEGRVVPAANGPIPQPNQQPMSILQMLSKSQQADQAALEAQHHQHAPAVSQDLLFKLLQVQQTQQQQQENVNKIIQGNVNQANRHFQVSPILNDMGPHMGNLQSRELLQRPEALAIIHGLKQGEITPQNLMQQMGNPGLQGRHREVIASILKMHQQQQQQQSSSPHARLALPTQPPQQQLRISPLPPNAIAQRIPSPRELQAHTQSIMQGALIKKKLEEQRENYRRRQELLAPTLTHTATPAPVASPTKHPAAIAFTPTSVLRKMTAEKDTEHILPKAAGWGAPPLHTQQAPVPKHARPIVKGNAAVGMNMPAYQTSPPEYPSAPYMNHPQQQFPNNLLQQQAAAAARNKIGHQSHHQFHAMVMQMQRQQHQQLQTPQHQHQTTMQVNNRGAPISGNGANLQQLLVHPHHRNHNEGVSAMGPALSPTSNQLARWFSPELLAQATAGKLPSVNMAQNVLSLEELERIQHSEAIVHN